MVLCLKKSDLLLLVFKSLKLRVGDSLLSLALSLMHSQFRFSWLEFFLLSQCSEKQADRVGAGDKDRQDGSLVYLPRVLRSRATHFYPQIAQP